MKINKSYLYIIILGYILISCSVGRKMSESRSKTGISEDYVYTHRDSLYLTGPHQWYYHDYKKKNSINITNQFVPIAIWIGQTEVTNRQYNFFLNSLLRDSLYEVYNTCKPDATGWLRIDSLNPFYIKQSMEYHISPEFLDFPVVNVSLRAVKEYIHWLNKNEPSENIIYKLPSEDEWMKGFNHGGLEDSTYAWGHNSCFNNKNSLLGNFAMLDPEQWRYDQVSDKFWFQNFKSDGYKSIINGPEKFYAYNPNEMGAYNMSGNVAEIIEGFIGNNELQTDTTNICWTKGGSWLSPPYYGRNHMWERYILPSPCVGFRVVKYEFEKK